jgi:hypothetical protein
MSGFTSGLELLLSGAESVLSTGSPELDALVGGIRRGMFYLFYGEKELIEVLFRYLIANALKPREGSGRPVVVYMLCGNYRKERTEIGTEELVELVEASGYGMEEALRRIHILTASSADQQALLIDELIGVLEREPEVSLVLIRGIFKLHFDDARVRNRHVVRESGPSPASASSAPRGGSPSSPPGGPRRRGSSQSLRAAASSGTWPTPSYTSGGGGRAPDSTGLFS